MSAVAFDTLKFAQTLRDKAKFTPEQAEGPSEAFAQASADRLASKADISGLRSDLREAELRLEAKIEATRAEILKWMFGTIGFQTIVIWARSLRSACSRTEPAKRLADVSKRR